MAVLLNMINPRASFLMKTFDGMANEWRIYKLMLQKLEFSQNFHM